MTATTACAECFRRAWLLAMLAPYIEKVLASPSSFTVRELLSLSNDELVRLAAPKVAEQMLARAGAISEQHCRDQLRLGNCWAICRHCDHYPEPLRSLDDPPWALFGRGDRDLLPTHGSRGTIAIVGARRATSYGREVARELGRDLGKAGALIVSGLSFGIDACAHRGALEEGRTIAVLGCGPDVAYPASHRSLYRQITESGLILSELPPGTPPWRWTFSSRARIIAGLSAMTVVVEAAERSGSLLVAERAASAGRVVGSVPGPITSRASAGTNALLASGGIVVRNASDVIDRVDGLRSPQPTDSA